MKKGLTRLLLFWSCMCLLTTVRAANYYWVGNGGSWNDPMHWASSSGGAGGAYGVILPTQDDNVFFDANSFSMADQVVLLATGDNYCRNMTWTGVDENPTLKFPSAVCRLNVYYSIQLNENMSVDFVGAEILGVIRMLDTRAVRIGDAAAVATRGITIPNISFEGVNGIWAIPDDLNVAGQMKITNGTFRNGGVSNQRFIVTANEFIVDGASVELAIDRMDITATSLFRIANLAMLTTSSGNGSNTKLSNISTALFQITASNATDFGSLHITGTNGVLSAAGKNLQFEGDVYLEGSTTSTVLGSHAFEGNIILTHPNSIILLEAGSTQTFSNKTNIIANGTGCANYYTLKSTVDGSAANLVVSGGNGISVERFYIQDIHGTPAGKFSAGQSVDLGNVVGWEITEAAGVTFYWIGGTGNWSDGSHWSSTSGGPTQSGCVPTAADNVIFDENSFPGSTHVVTVNLPAIYFNTMIWTDPDNDQPTWRIPTGSVNIGGSLTLAPSMNVVIVSPATTFFNFTSDASDNTVTASNTAQDGFDLANITFDGSGSWSLGGELYTSGNIHFNQGTFSTGNDYNISATQINIDGDGVVLDLNDSEIFVETFSLLSVGTFSAELSNIYVTKLLEVTPAGINFNQVFMEGTETELRGNNLIFVDLQLNSSIQTTIFGSHTYSNLLQFNEAGMIVEFEAGTTQNIANIESLGGDCGGGIFVRTTVSGSQVNFVATDGPIVVPNILLQDNAASPAMAFSASGSQDLGNNSNWDFAGGSAATRFFYWRGGSGNWNEGNKWLYSTIFGEVPTNTNCIPTPSDDVYFDAESFTAPGQTISLNSDQQYCRNMFWAGDVEGVPTMNIGAGNTLNIYGGLLLQAKTIMNLTFGDGDDAILWFRAKDDNNGLSYGIVTSNHDIPNITFEGFGGGWELNGGTSILSNVILNAGHFNTSGFSLEANQFIINGATAELTLDASTLTIHDLFQISAISALNAGSSSLLTNVLTSSVSGLAFNNVQMINKGSDVFAEIDTEINGNGLTFNTLILSGRGTNTVHGSHQFNTALQFDYDGTSNPAPLTFFTFDAGSTQTLASNCDLLSNSNTSTNSSLQSSEVGAAATFSKAGRNVCLEYIRIFDIVAEGGAIFGFNNLTAGVFGNSSGWVPTVGSTCALFLPVECTDFTATATSTQEVALSWTTAQEINNSGFEVQRSTDGRRFETIAWVDGAGTTSEARKYTYTDRRTEGLEQIYYRLLQIDFDGTNAYACDVQAVSLRNTSAGPLIIYPNPAEGDLLQVRWFGKKAGSTLIRLYDQSGRLILNREWSSLEGSNQQELPIADLARGIYELQMVDANGKMQSTRLIKQ